MISRKDIRDAKTLLGVLRDSIEDAGVEGASIVGFTVRINQQLVSNMAEAKSLLSAMNTALGQFAGEKPCELQVHFDMLHPEQAKLEQTIQAKIDAIQKLQAAPAIVGVK